MIFDLDSPAATQSLAREIGQACAGGEVLLLRGELGAGKTCFVQGLARGLGVPDSEPVTSPTFTLHAQYSGRLELNHIDLYRLANGGGLPGLGFDELFGAPGTVAAVEWSEYLGRLRPAEYLEIKIRILAGTKRVFSFAPTGRQHEILLEKLAGRAGRG